jgi:hypothetical protein
LANILQVVLTFADHFALFGCVSVDECAWESLRGYLGGDDIGNGRYISGRAMGSLHKDHTARELRTSFVWIRIGGMRDFFFSLSPDKSRIKACNFLCDSMELFACDAQRRTRRNRRAEPRIISSSTVNGCLALAFILSRPLTRREGGHEIRLMGMFIFPVGVNLCAISGTACCQWCLDCRGWVCGRLVVDVVRRGRVVSNFVQEVDVPDIFDIFVAQRRFRRGVDSL